MSSKFKHPEQYCFTCKKSNLQLLTCKRCKIAKYCSKECQVKEWPEHQKMCEIPEVVNRTLLTPKNIVEWVFRQYISEDVKKGILSTFEAHNNIYLSTPKIAKSSTDVKEWITKSKNYKSDMLLVKIDGDIISAKRKAALFFKPVSSLFCINEELLRIFQSTDWKGKIPLLFVISLKGIVHYSFSDI